MADHLARLEAENKNLRSRNEVLEEENARLVAASEATIFPRLHLSSEISQNRRGAV
jgi:hypothetical protein